MASVAFPQHRADLLG